MAKAPAQAIEINVIDKDGFTVGRITARIGLKTYAGEIVRLTPKGFVVRTDTGAERVFHQNIRMPSIYKSYAPKGEVRWR
jgi:hypothetical protein